MKTFFRENKRYLQYAGALHLALLIIVCLNWQWLPEETGVNLDAPIINAVMMEQTSPASKPVPVKQVQVQPTPEAPKPVEQPKPAPKIEAEKPIVKTEDDPNAIALTKPKVKPKPKKTDQDLLRQLDQEQKELQHQKQQQQQTQLEQQLQQQLAKEESISTNAAKASPAKASAPAANNALSSAEIDKYKAQILAAISQEWIVPPNAADKFCKFLIRLAPGGVVLEVKLLQSSGNEALDRSARAAVFKASPLPVPTENALFDAFRELNLTVHPKDSAT